MVQILTRPAKPRFGVANANGRLQIWSSSNVTVALHFASLPLAEQAFSDSKARLSGPCTCTIPKVVELLKFKFQSYIGLTYVCMCSIPSTGSDPTGLMRGTMIKILHTGELAF
ncbi:hypothetical protein PAXRUDRAFT_494372 [Paxillus rubicundulus Ve08.2h10]|uniref:Uncharacterized protein n=1 Tax=Paxillus rubicundulus Ve08.2h10 TaxID=930991 RepID=A0A0D0D9K9_9AGAM|nr:hypothetical protein PAXRUDRAFT_494372 [Paxillus rubicundulus Ve08.2h10]